MRYLALLGLLGLVACEKGEPTLDETVILSITATPATIVNYGDTSIIEVRATESDGRPVFDGARIQFTADGGSIPSEARTADGVATVVFTSDATLGSYSIIARSGDLGADGSVMTTVQVVDRNVEIGSAVLGLNPSNLTSAGGTSELSMVVTDPAGTPIPNRTVVFSSDYGHLAHNGSPIFTDSAGVARETMTLNSLPSEVTAVKVSAQVGTMTVERDLSITTNANPLPVFTFSPQTPTAGEPVFFFGQESEDSDGNIVRYDWSFGDGDSASGESVSHTYNASRDFLVTLEVTDNQGASAATSSPISIGSNQLPTAEFNFSPSSPRVGQVVVFNAQGSADPDGTIERYQWTMGNGFEREGSVVSFAYPGAGTYTVTLTVTDNSGGTATASESITVTGNQRPDAQFTFSPPNPRVSDLVTFDATTSTDSDGTVTSHTWNFGNGFIADGEIVSISYAESGSYLVQLTVKDNDGGLGFATQTITVANNAPPTASFTFTPQDPKVDETVVFDASASSDSDGRVTSYLWNFGDNSTGSGRVTTHKFSAPGDYRTTLRVGDDDGGSDNVSLNVPVGRGGIPVARLILTPENLTPPSGQVLLDATASTDQENALGELSFFFEAFAPDGVTVSIPSGSGPLRLVNLDGLQNGDQVVFSVRVRDLDLNEGFDSQVLTAGSSTTNQRPTADFTITPTQLQVPGGQVILDGTTSSDPNDPLSSLTFDVSFQVAGTVQVALNGSGPLRTATLMNGLDGDVVTFLLTVTDPGGLQDTVTRNLFLVDGPSNNTPTAVLLTVPAGSVTLPTPPTDPIGITLDARNSMDIEDPLANLLFFFASDSTNPGGITITIDQNMQVPALAIATVQGAQAGDQLVFTVVVQDTGGLQDQDAVILQVVDPP